MPGPGLYIHIPFCSSICPYCDFAVVIAGRERRSGLIQSLPREAAMYSGRFGAFDTVYLGGGTPSSLEADQIAGLLDGVGEGLEISPTAGMSIEVNPDDVTPQSAGAWRELGFSTVSVGVQSFDDRILGFLGRRHDSDRAMHAIDTLKAAGFATVSIDLIFGVAGQNLEDWIGQLEQAVAMEVDHLSCYQLTIHRRTIFGRRFARGAELTCGEDPQAELFMATHTWLADRGYEGYEVSNFAMAPHHRSRHNLKYWSDIPYLGLGPSAHSYLNASRWWNQHKLRLWQNAVDAGQVPVAGGEDLQPRERILERVMLGLRMRSGFDCRAIIDEFQFDVMARNRDLLSRFVESRHLEIDGEVVRPTLAGMAVADGIACQFDLDPV